MLDDCGLNVEQLHAICMGAINQRHGLNSLLEEDADVWQKRSEVNKDHWPEHCLSNATRRLKKMHD